MTEDDITAFRPVSAAAPSAAPPRRRVWPWLLLGAFVLFTVLTAAGLAVVAQLSDLAGSNVSVTIDDDTVALGAIDAGHGLAIALGLGLALLVVLVVVPITLLFAFGAAALGICVALAAVLGVFAVAVSPLLLIGAIAWWALRPRRRASAVSSSA